MSGLGYWRFSTPAGDMIAWSNGTRDDGRTHVGIRTEHEHNRWEHYAPSNGGWEGVASSATFSRVAYHVHEHYAYATKLGTRSLEPIGTGNPLRRAEAFSLEDGTPSAVRAFRDVVEPALLDFLATDEGQQMIREGEEERRANRRAELELKATELSTELRAIRAELRKLGK
jgi:hypothetical protein